MDRSLPSRPGHSRTPESTGDRTVATRHPAGPDRGFTLIEVLVALLLLAGTGLLIAGVMLRAVSVADRARQQAVMVTLAEQRLEQLLALRWGLGDAAAPTPDADTTSDLSGPAPASGGAGVALSPGDALAVTRTGYADFLDRWGGWLSAGPATPVGAAFVRRWRVGRTPGSPTLLLEVQVEPLDPSAVPSGPSARGLRLVAARAQLAGWP